jgi:hypothetical protein
MIRIVYNKLLGAVASLDGLVGELETALGA